MSRHLVLVVTKSHDPTADHLFGRMQARNIPFLRLNIDTFVASASLSLHLSRDARWVLRLGQDVIDGDEIRSVFIRRKVAPTVDDVTDLEARQFAEREFSLMLSWWLGSIRRPFLDTPETIERAANKWAQLQAAQASGLEIPPTLFTNDPAAASEFLEQPQTSVVKTLGGLGLIRQSGFYSVYTSIVNGGDVEFIEDLRHGPAIFQCEVKKKHELRVTVVGERFFACCIESQRSERAKLDWRRYDMSNTPHYATELPHRVKEKLIQIMASFGIRFVAFDLIVTPDDRYVFLEMNPSPQWVWIEQATNLPITDAIVDYLMAAK